MRWFSPLLAGSILSVSLVSWGAGTLSGKVTDTKTGQPIENAVVQMITPDDGQPLNEFNAYTDAGGEYEIKSIPPGSWKVLFSGATASPEYQEILYDGIICPQNECGWNEVGDVILIADGANVLDYSLQTRYLPKGIMAVLISMLNQPLGRASDRPAISSLYDSPWILIDANSPNFPNILNQPEPVDLNGDGRVDAVFSDNDPQSPEGDSFFYAMLATPSGDLELSTEKLLSGDTPYTDRGYRQIIPADFNGDGHTDLFLESHGGEPDCGDGSVHCWTGGLNSLLLSDGTGQLIDVTNTNMPAHSDFTHGSSVADFDNDGDIDIWVHNLGGSPLYNPEISYLMHNDGTGSFSIVADTWDQHGSPPIVGKNGILPEGDLGTFWSFAIDVENDGDTDLGLGFSWGLNKNIVLINDGAGHFSLPPGEAFPSPRDYTAPQIQHSVVADINNDNLEDALLHQSRSNLTDPVLQILISKGDGTFADETSLRFPNGPVEISQFQLHDFDRDGHSDLFYSVSGNAFIGLNDGDGYFRGIGDEWTQGLGWNWIALDVDGDGDTDFLSGEWYGIVLHRMKTPFPIDQIGTKSDDIIIGGAHNNDFSGLSGDDLIDSGLGNDKLQGGPGNDELHGGKGNDSYILDLADLGFQDIILDKGGNDIIVLVNFGLEGISLASQDESGNLILEFSGGGKATVSGHFLSLSNAIESIKIGPTMYSLGQDPSFKSGTIQDLIL